MFPFGLMILMGQQGKVLYLYSTHSHSYNGVKYRRLWVLADIGIFYPVVRLSFSSRHVNDFQ